MGGEKSVTPNNVKDLNIKEEDLNNSKIKTFLANLDTGINNSSLNDTTNVILYDKAADETILPADAPKHNTFIVFGRDRLGPLNGIGYGTKGEPKAGAIDIVVGIQSKKDASLLVDKTGKPAAQSPDPFSDASRIYLSQKADIDEYFVLPYGATYNSKSRAAIAIKSDDIRIISRNTLKIVTNSDNECSNGEPNEKLVGLQLLAVNKKSIQGLDAPTLAPEMARSMYKPPGREKDMPIMDLQPMVKGDNLILCLKSIIRDLRTLNGIVKAFMGTQKEFNEQVANHTHFSPFFGIPTSPSKEAVAAGISMRLKLFSQTEMGLNAHLNQLQKTELEYLDNSANVIHINSQFHKLN